MTFLTSSPGQIKESVLVVGSYSDRKYKPVSTLLSSADKKQVGEILERKEFSSKSASVSVVHLKNSTWDMVVVLGLGRKKKLTSEVYRRAGASARKALTHEGMKAAAVDADGLSLSPEEIQAFSEGICLSTYRYTKHKSKPSGKVSDIKFRFVSNKRAVLSVAEKSCSSAEKIAKAVFVARDFANEPANFLYPGSYADRLKDLFKGSKVKCEIFDEKKLESLKMGGILAVGKGSERGPRLVILEYNPKKTKTSRPIVLVGKGVTFDTGGISLKPGKSMDEMKFDMCGSAAVAGALKAISDLNLPVHVVGLLPMAENMPDGKAQRPGDVITCYGGKTVEVYNTDAEGRLILADALAFSEKYKPRYVVDIATLTGACAYTLDYAGSGVMGNKPELVQKLLKAGEISGERLWEFPLWDEYSEFIRGSYGDIRNISRRTAGIQTAGAFLKHFGDHSSWAHIDIAGTAWGEARHYTVEGATGVGVRLFVEFVKSCNLR